MKKDLYIDHWKKYLPVIKILLKKISNGKQELKLFKHEFEACGDRPKSGFDFNLEFKTGKVSNDISGSAVARNLATVLQGSSDRMEVLKDKQFKMSFDEQFILHLQKK